MAGDTIEYKIRQWDNEKLLRWRKTNDWGFKPKSSKPERNVYFLDISMTLPLDATAGYAKIGKMASEETGSGVELSNDSCQRLSYVLGQQYERARFTGTDIDAGREVGILTRACGEISQFHQGAGEDSMLDTFKLLQNIPNYSLLVIDEVENSLHPKAQRRLIRYLIELTRVKKLQIILSTHSPFVLDELPEVARIMLVQLSGEKDILYGVSTEFALSTIDDNSHPEYYAYFEDEEAIAMFWEIIKHNGELYSKWCTTISTCAVGSCSVVSTLNDLGKNKLLPHKSFAVVDGDKREDHPNCLALPGLLAPERQVLTDLKAQNWCELDERFGIGAGSLFKYFDDAVLLPDHHEWTTYIGDHIRKSKDVVWSVMLEEWHKHCLSHDTASEFISLVEAALQ